MLDKSTKKSIIITFSDPGDQDVRQILAHISAIDYTMSYMRREAQALPIFIIPFSKWKWKHYAKIYDEKSHENNQ